MDTAGNIVTYHPHGDLLCLIDSLPEASVDARPGHDLLAPISCQRMAIGSGMAELQRFPASWRTCVASSGSIIHLVVPITGRILTVSPSGIVGAMPGTALLLARTERTNCVGHTGATVLVIRLRRARIQIRASEILDIPSRLAGIVAPLPIAPRNSLATAVASLVRRMSGDRVSSPAAGAAFEHDIVEGLVETLRAENPAAFSTARSVERALGHIRAHYPRKAMPLEELARIAGVTLGTLRRNFTDCLGVPISACMQRAQLDWIHERLCCSTECRSVGQLADAAGFTSSKALSKAYQRRFGETPSRTRMSAFAAMHD